MDEQAQMLIIRRNDFLDKLTKENYETLNVLHNYIIADKDAYIYFDAHFLNKLYFVKEGFVKVGVVDDEGNELIKDILRPGDVFGQFMLERNNMMGEFAQAHRCETILCSFTLNDFERLLALRPDLAIVFSRKIGQKLKNIENRLLNLLQRDVRTRVLYFFYTILPPEVIRENTVKLANYLTHDDIARLTGTSRQTVTTVISQLQEEGLISIDRRSIVIHDVNLLQKLAKVG
jgi:CRP/FNR family cyclic AMP-dependent transcriptional regulator